MEWGLGILACLGLVSLLAVARLRHTRRARRRYEAAVSLWNETPPAMRAERLEKLVRVGEAEAPNPGAWFLLGCARLRDGRPDLAVPAFGMAHHADWRLESAALLTFACLKTAAAGESGDFLRDVAATWEEMKRPVLPRLPWDGTMFECLESTTRDPPRLSSLGRLAWMVAGPELQTRLEVLATSAVGGWAAVLVEESVEARSSSVEARGSSPAPKSP